MKTILVALALSFVGLTAHAEVGDDGLHKQPWFTVTFKDVAEDMADAADAGKRLAIIFEQRGCIYCAKMHKEVLSDPDVAAYIAENFTVVQYNLYGDEEVVDLNGDSITEKEAAQRWGIVFTPTVIFLGEDAPEDATVKDAAVQTMPGAFGKGTVLDMFTWIRDKGYDGDEAFQRYHARMIQARSDGDGG